MAIVETGMTGLLKAGGQLRVTRKVRKGTKHLSSDTAVLGKGGCAVSCDTFTIWLRFPCTQDFGHLGKLFLSTSTLQSTVKVSSHTELAAVARGDSNTRGKFLTKDLKEKKQTW